MGRFNYEEEPLRDILFIDVKSFYASVECVQRGLDPLTALLVVMSHSDNTGNGLVLAASPMAKTVLGITNVTRADNLPNHPDLYKVSPRMNLYIKENLKVNNVYRNYVADEDLLLYSIDESLMDVTQTLHLFFLILLFLEARSGTKWQKNQRPCLQSDRTAGNCRDR